MTSKKALPISTFGSGFWVSYQNSPAKKMRILEFSPSDGNGSSADDEPLPQDADYDAVSLSDELETSILARFPRSQHWKLCFINKWFLNLIKSGEIYKIRRELGFKEPTVFMLASGESNWWGMDWPFKSSRKLPPIQSDYNFEYGDKESFTAGSHLLVSGKEIDGAVIWRYDSETDEWLKGPSMINPRCLFASATCGNFAFVAGGIETNTYSHVLDSAEKYNSVSQTWELLPKMNQKRKFCSGCFMDNKFYVIGGQDEHLKDLTCGEFFDAKTNSWNLIPDMCKDIPLSVSQSPPLLAVVNNELYTLDASSNELKVYMKGSNTWKKLGVVPVRADAQGGWGVAFKSLGDEILVIGASAVSHTERALTVYTCCPDPDIEKLRWKQIECGSIQLNHFIRNCAVMGT
ncbi:F-box/kelch-repeat protein At3g27150 [Gastrolobium bilobum]|uniref:F-box/kelch-repeat protein At3g27150 n=1 Tax=Gastrolobium bilobum TaxID=150636 RepID=UPI002AB30D75|nr:F-box/kelch-repeat protein At3g27150 [Gastrolobium bilobum]